MDIRKKKSHGRGIFEKKITWSFSLSIKTMSLRDTNIIALDLTEHRA